MSAALCLLRRVRPEWVQGALVVLLCLMLVSSGTALVSMALWQWPAPLVAVAAEPGPASADGGERMPRPLKKAASNGSDGSRRGAGSPAPLDGARRRPGRRPRRRQQRERERAGPPGRSPPQIAPRQLAGERRALHPTTARDRFWSVTVREVTPDATFAGTARGLTGVSSRAIARTVFARRPRCRACRPGPAADAVATNPLWS